MNDTLEIDIQLVRRDENDAEILIAVLADSGFDAFRVEEDHLYAYLEKGSFEEAGIRVLLEPFKEILLSLSSRRIPYKNWNEEWEASYEAVDILNTCHVRAPFHPEPVNRNYDLVISPKMSFGTAHHETTRLILEYMLGMDMEGRTVLDLGCGTGILGILAAKMGADSVLGVDNDPQACRNAIENVKLNGTDGIRIAESECKSLDGNSFNIILANINLNILVRDLPCISERLENGGYCLLSGFYEYDLMAIERTARAAGLVRKDVNTLNRWTVAVYIKAV